MKWPRRSQHDAEVARELRDHLELEAEEHEALGNSPVDASNAARRAFGNETQIREDLRAMGKFVSIEVLLRDFRFAVRILLKSRGFTAVAILTIALGIGANTAIFAVVNEVLLKPLAYRDAERIVVPATVFQRYGTDRGSVAYADILDWKEQGDLFEAVAAVNPANFTVAGGEQPERVTGLMASWEYFGVFTDTPLIGRVFTQEEDMPEANRVVLLAEGLWKRRFGGDAGVVGQSIEVSGEAHMVIGVMPANSIFPEEIEMIKPLGIGPQRSEDLLRRDNHTFRAVARLRNGVDIGEAGARLEVMGARLAAEHTNRENTGWKLHRLQDYVVGPMLGRMLWILMGAVLLVLLIACANVANLFLARGEARQRELAVRNALGAGWGRVARQFLVESLVLALAGGILGTALGYAGTVALAHFAPEGVPRLEGVTVDLRVLGFAFGLSVLTAVLFGLAPVFQAMRSAPATSIREGGRAASDGSRSAKIRNVLVVSEVALSLMLLAGAWLLVQSFANLQQVNPGFSTERLITMEVGLPVSRYAEDRVSLTYAEMIEALRSIPGVTAASSTSSLPLSGGGFYLGRVFLRSGQPEPPASNDASGQWSVIQPGYLETLGVPIVMGRGFSEADTARSNPVILISESMAQEMFPNGNPLGQRIRSWRDENKYREVIGVVKDLQYQGLSDPLVNNVYVPQSQDPWRFQVFVIRTADRPANSLSAFKEAIWSVDRKVAISAVKTLDEIIDSELARPRFLMFLLGVFAVTALVMAAIGIYGLMAYSVAQRSREIGIRMALGAVHRDIVKRVAGHALLLACVGVAVGILGALMVTRLMDALLFGVSPTDAGALGTAATILILVALLAAYIPARRASKVDPLVVLRNE